MVKIGFIVEGHSEKILIESDMFKEWCQKNRITIAHPVINAGGGGNLLPQYLANHIARVSQNGKPNKVVVLTDLETTSTVADVRERILTKESKDKIDIVFVSVKALEAWILADGAAMAAWLKEESFHEGYPEATPAMPREKIKQIAKDKNKSGPGASKPNFIKKMIVKHGFSIERAAEHPHCPSVKEFSTTLKKWGEDNS
jgi:predicted ATP-dependent endonuclease of OLD family